MSSESSLYAAILAAQQQTMFQRHYEEANLSAASIFGTISGLIPPLPSVSLSSSSLGTPSEVSTSTTRSVSPVFSSEPSGILSISKILSIPSVKISLTTAVPILDATGNPITSVSAEMLYNYSIQPTDYQYNWNANSSTHFTRSSPSSSKKTEVRREDWHSLEQVTQLNAVFEIDCRLDNPLNVTKLIATTGLTKEQISRWFCAKRNKEGLTRKRFNPDQINELVESFRKRRHPDNEEKKRLARDTGLTVKQVETWFAQRRRKSNAKEIQPGFE